MTLSSLFDCDPSSSEGLYQFRVPLAGVTRDEGSADGKRSVEERFASFTARRLAKGIQFRLGVADC